MLPLLFFFFFFLFSLLFFLLLFFFLLIFFIARSTRQRRVTRRRVPLLVVEPLLDAKRNFVRSFSRKKEERKRRGEKERNEGREKGKTDPGFSMFSTDRISRHLSRHQSRLGVGFSLGEGFLSIDGGGMFSRKGGRSFSIGGGPRAPLEPTSPILQKLFNRPNVSVNETLPPRSLIFYR